MKNLYPIEKTTKQKQIEKKITKLEADFQVQTLQFELEKMKLKLAFYEEAKRQAKFKKYISEE